MSRHARPCFRAVPFIAAVLCLAGAAFAAPARPAPPPLAAAPRLDDITRDPADVSEYLGFWQKQAYARALANYRPMTVNQGAYDVRTYDLDLHPDIPSKVLTATVRMRATVTAGPLSSVDLDLDEANMTCDAATSSGTPITFSQGGGVLTLALERAYNTGETFDVTVAYHGSPSAGAFGAAFGWDLHNGSTLVSTLSEPYDARTWWPCKDDPSDKADSVDVRLTMPAGYKTASNGRQVEFTDNGTTAYSHWHERHPIATYLVSIASFPYSVWSDWYKSTPTDSMEIRFHLFPETVSGTNAVHLKVKNMIAAFTSRYNAYGFLDEKYGHAQFLWGGGMENQTCTSLGAFGEYTVAHELAHQWFGDKVTCRNFHHIWLNEGFATYNEAVWAEQNGGLAAFHSSMSNKTYYGAGTVYVPDTTDVNRIFSTNLTYRKGGWVLTMLRHIMGDTQFYTGMRNYLAQYAYSTAVTEDFQHVMEAACGRDLTKFFQEWVYGEYYPQYRFNAYASASPGGGFDVSCMIQQTQTWQQFWMPVDVRINTATTSYTFVANDSTPVQLFSFHVPQQPTSYVLDPDQWILRTVAYVTGAPAPGATTLELSAPSPNPTHGRTSFAYSTPHDGDADVTIVDATGRRVARLQHGTLAAGRHTVEWSGRADNGRALAPGVYWVNFQFGGQRLTQRVAVLN